MKTLACRGRSFVIWVLREDDDVTVGQLELRYGFGEKIKERPSVGATIL